MRKIAFMAMVVVGATSAQANSISTFFIGTNSGAQLWTNYFDVTVGANPLQVTAFEVNALEGAGLNYSIDVYTRVGTYSGFETNGGAGWTLVGSGSAVSSATDTPSFVDTSDFVMGSGVSGMAIRYTGISPRYTNGNGSNQNFNNADVALALGSSAATTAGAFAAGSSLFTPRVWNGTIYYNVVPEPVSMIAMGAGLLALVRRRRQK